MTITLDQAPTGRQLRYLRVLAAKTGSTFTPPMTRSEASGEIDRMRLLEGGPTHESFDDRGAAVHYATAIDAEEVSGYGSSASWRSSPPPRMRLRADRRGEGQLARYELSAGARVLCGERFGGLVRVTDRPADRTGRCYVVESAVEPDGLKALLTEYVTQAGALDDVPMASSALSGLLRAGADV